jgi:hypothetical protein
MSSPDNNRDIRSAITLVGIVELWCALRYTVPAFRLQPVGM